MNSKITNKINIIFENICLYFSFFIMLLFIFRSAIAETIPIISPPPINPSSVRDCLSWKNDRYNLDIKPLEREVEKIRADRDKYLTPGRDGSYGAATDKSNIKATEAYQLQRYVDKEYDKCVSAYYAKNKAGRYKPTGQRKTEPAPSSTIRSESVSGFVKTPLQSSVPANVYVGSSCEKCLSEFKFNVEQNCLITPEGVAGWSRSKCVKDQEIELDRCKLSCAASEDNPVNLDSDEHSIQKSAKTKSSAQPDWVRCPAYDPYGHMCGQCCDGCDRDCFKEYFDEWWAKHPEQ